jgi:sensor histidine kinase YesM
MPTMYLSSTPNAELWPDTLKGVLRAIAVAAVFWALAATLLYLLSPGLDTWPRLLAFSECVGLTMVACVLLLRRTRAFSRFNPMTRWILTGIIAIPTGYFVGHQFAFLLLGEPLRMVGYLSVSLIPIIFTMLVGGLGLHSYATREQLAQEAAARSEAQRLAVESQLRLLRAQLEPHMLFNTLANLRVLITADPQRAVAMLDRLNSYLRATLSGSRALAHPLSAEFELLRDYLELMSVRMGDRLHYTLDLPEDLRNVAVPPLLLQPLVENAIQHGLEPKVGGGSIAVRARRQGTGSDARLVIEVNDTGVGLSQHASTLDEPGRGFGLTQVRERLASTYGDRGAITLAPAGSGGTCAAATLPLN